MRRNRASKICQDDDEWSYTYRFENQVGYIERNQELAAVSRKRLLAGGAGRPKGF